MGRGAGAPGCSEENQLCCQGKEEHGCHTCGRKEDRCPEGPNWLHCHHRVLLGCGVVGSGRLRLQPRELRDIEVGKPRWTPRDPAHPSRP